MTCPHLTVFSMDCMPPIWTCTDCGETLPMTEQDKRDYRDYTGHDHEGDE